MRTSAAVHSFMQSPSFSSLDVLVRRFRDLKTINQSISQSAALQRTCMLLPAINSRFNVYGGVEGDEDDNDNDMTEGGAQPAESASSFHILRS